MKPAASLDGEVKVRTSLSEVTINEVVSSAGQDDSSEVHAKTPSRRSPSPHNHDSVHDISPPFLDVRTKEGMPKDANVNKSSDGEPVWGRWVRDVYRHKLLCSLTQFSNANRQARIVHRIHPKAGQRMKCGAVLREYAGGGVEASAGMARIVGIVTSIIPIFQNAHTRKPTRFAGEVNVTGVHWVTTVLTFMRISNMTR